MSSVKTEAACGMADSRETKVTVAPVPDIPDARNTMQRFNVYLHIVKKYAHQKGIKPDINGVLELFREHY